MKMKKLALFLAVVMAVSGPAEAVLAAETENIESASEEQGGRRKAFLLLRQRS